MTPISEKFSWKSLDDGRVLKELDFTSFNHGVTPITKDKYSFFGISSENFNLTLVYENKEHEVEVKWTKYKNNKKFRMFWRKGELLSILKKKFNDWEDLKPGDRDPSRQIIFEKTSDSNRFNIDLVILKSGKNTSRKREIKRYVNSQNKRRFINCRVGQKEYRENLLIKWNGKCPITQIDDPSILISSHILSWRDSNDKEKGDVENGILLSPTFDSLFDRNLISFKNDGSIIISKKISIQNRNRMNLTESIKIPISNGMIPYLEKHRLKLKELEGNLNISE